jgi:hypothetical protein
MKNAVKSYESEHIIGTKRFTSASDAVAHANDAGLTITHIEKYTFKNKKRFYVYRFKQKVEK